MTDSPLRPQLTTANKAKNKIAIYFWQCLTIV